MSHTVREVKIGELYDGSSCCSCNDLLFLGDDGVICEACGSASHARCWNTVKGCNGCNRRVSYEVEPLPQPPRPVAQQYRRTLERGESFCASCGDIVWGYCFRCENLYPQPAYTGPKTTLPQAKDALKYALVGLVCFGFILGPIAIMKGTSAKKQIAANPIYEGAGLATAAQIIGAIDLLFYVSSILSAIAGVN